MTKLVNTKMVTASNTQISFKWSQPSECNVAITEPGSSAPLIQNPIKDTILCWIWGSHRLCFLPESCWFIAVFVIWSWIWSRDIPPKPWWLSPTYTALYPKRENSPRFLFDYFRLSTSEPVSFRPISIFPYSLLPGQTSGRFQSDVLHGRFYPLCIWASTSTRES